MLNLKLYVCVLTLSCDKTFWEYSGRIFFFNCLVGFNLKWIYGIVSFAKLGCDKSTEMPKNLV